MKITEVRIFPTESKDGKLKAFATMTFDDWFVVRNVKVIQGNNGLFVAMPSRKAMVSCPKCSFKNVVGAKFCNQCGAGIPPHKEEEHGADKQGNHMDIAHPITQECRVYIQDKILEAYNSGEKQEAGDNVGNKVSAKEEAIAPVAPIEVVEEEVKIEENASITEEANDIEL